MSMLNKESPCVMQMIKDVRSVYDAIEDGSGRGDGITIYFLDATEKFVVSQDATFPMPTGDGGVYMETETMWEQSYSWNEMTSWYFSNRPFSLSEFRQYNNAVLKAFYMSSDEINHEDSTIESFTEYAYYNPHYVPDAGHCHGELGHKL